MLQLRKIDIVKGKESIPTHFHGHHELPAIIVIQEWWGINDQVKVHAEEIAAQGYDIAIPDLYRGKLGLDVEEAKHLMHDLDFKEAVEDIRRVAKYLKAEGTEKIGIVGFCMGGALVLAANALIDEIDAGVCFYGIPPPDLADLSKMTKPVQCHFGNNDTMKGFSSPEAVDRLEEKFKAGGVNYELYRYDNVGHAFMNEEEEAVKLRHSMGIHEADHKAVKAAWDRTFEFFATHLK